MGGVMDFIFGNEPTPSRSSSTPTATTTAAQRALIDKLSNYLSGQVGTGVTPYQGNMVAGMTGTGRSAQDLINQMMAGGGTYGNIMNQIVGYNPAAGATGQMGASQFDMSQILGPTATGVGNVVGPTGGGFDPEAATKAWKLNVLRPTMSAWEEEVLPSILEPFAGSGTMSSSGAQKTAAREGRRMMEGMSGQLANMLYQGEEAGRAREFTGAESYAGREQSAIENALARAMGAGESYAGRVMEGLGTQFGGEESLRSRLAGLETTGQGNLMSALGMTGLPIQMGMSMDETSRAIQNAQLQSQYQQWLSGQVYQNPWLQMLGTSLGVNPYGVGNVSTGGTPASQGLLGWAGSFFGGSGGIYT